MEEPEFFESELSQDRVIDGHHFRIEIYSGGGKEWILEVVDELNSSTVWDDPFPSEKAALDEFERFIAVNGAKGILDAEFHGAA